MSRFKNWKKPEFDEDGWAYPDADDRYQKLHSYGWRCLHSNNLKLGHGSDIGCFTFINAKYGVEIGEDVQIGGGCFLYSESTIDNKKGTIHIKKNAKIGAHCVIMPNISIGENSIIGACSFVNKSIPDNVVAFGVPCKVKYDR